MNKIFQQKLKAYTILEVTVTMIIALISIVIAYTALHLVQQSYRRFDQRNEQVATLLLTDKLLRKDFSEALIVSRTPEGINMVRDSFIINYSFYPDYILRDQNSIRNDTLFLRSNDLLLTFEGNSVDEGGRVDLLKFQVLMVDKSISMTYNKLYSAADLYFNDAGTLTSIN